MYSYNKLDARLNGSVKEWGLHDARRAAATHLCDKLDVQPHIVEAILNHLSGHRAGVAGIYQRAKYETQMRSALQAYAEWIEGLQSSA